MPRHLTNEDQNLVQINTIIDAGILTGNVNDWNPAGFSDADIIEIDVNANQRRITGMLAPPAGVNRIIGINNKNSASNDLRFTHNDASSIAANRFLLRDNGQRSIKPNETAVFWYSHNDQRWKPYNRVG